MHTTSSRSSAQTCNRPTPRIPTICIVDSQAGNYSRWQDAEANGVVQLHIVADAETALKFSRTHRIDQWVIKTELPGLSGFELCAMLKSQSSSATVWLVAKDYSPQAERRAWSSRATVFCCEATLEEHLATVIAKPPAFIHSQTN